MTRRIAAASALLLVATACAGGPPPDKDRGALIDKAVSTTEPGESTNTTAPGSPASAHATDESETQTAEPGRAAAPTTTTTESVATTSATATTTASATTVGHRFAPPAGRYEYDATGTIVTGSGPTERRETPPPRQIDAIREEPATGGTTLTITTTSGDDTQETEFHVTTDRVTLVRLTYRSTTTQTVTPNPPIPIAELPYRPGARREFAWEDPTMGVQGIGAATIDTIEDVATPAGTFTTAAIAVRQRIRGAVTGSLDVTFWVDTKTGVHARRRVQTAFDGATGGTRSDITATLAQRP